MPHRTTFTDKCSSLPVTLRLYILISVIGACFNLTYPLFHLMAGDMSYKVFALLPVTCVYITIGLSMIYGLIYRNYLAWLAAIILAVCSFGNAIAMYLYTCKSTPSSFAFCWFDLLVAMIQLLLLFREESWRHVNTVTNE